MLPQSFLCVLVWCKACQRQAIADLQALVDTGRGDVQLRSLRFRSASCGSRLTDHVMMAKDALGGAAVALRSAKPPHARVDHRRHVQSLDGGGAAPRKGDPKHTIKSQENPAADDLAFMI
jgi:hypothetical protein